MYVLYRSEYVKQYIFENPVTVYEPYGSVGSRTPSLAMAEFYSLLETTGDLFGQTDYHRHLMAVWDGWHSSLTPMRQEYLRRRVFHSFYRSGIDQLFVQSLLTESGLFDRVAYDDQKETSGVDIVAVTMTGRRIPIQCQVDTNKADIHHKHVPGRITIKKNLKGKRIGNMPFYRRSDLQPILDMGMVDMLIGQNLPMFENYGRLHDSAAYLLPVNCTNSILTA